jgi:selenide, water dikinase
VMKNITLPENSRVIVGIETSDDAGVYLLTDTIALVQTVDYITPIVDDPYTFGMIAACNSLSDVYAMGGVPLTALNIVCFPTKLFSLDKLSDILKGGLDVMTLAGVQLLGGHTVDDRELKYGLSVTGTVHPGRILRNSTIKSGNSIVLTKRLGTGIIATALKAGLLDEAHYAPFAASMSALNMKAAGIMREYPVDACTDITGFGLAGHLREMIAGKNMKITVDSDSLRLLPGAAGYAGMGLIPAGMYRNRDFVGKACRIGDRVDPAVADVVFDPQTSGGLCISLKSEIAGELARTMGAHGIDCAVIGTVSDSTSPLIEVV